MFDRPHLLWLLVLVPLAAAPGILAMRGGTRLAGAAAATLRALCVVALVAMLAGLRVPGRIAAQSVAVVAALDESRSVSPDQQEWMRHQVEQLKFAMAPSDQLGIVGFGRDARLLAPLSDPRLLGHFGDGSSRDAREWRADFRGRAAAVGHRANRRHQFFLTGKRARRSALRISNR